jgi:pimeloyl-ACP methyl ester carboxylesterase
MKKAIIVIGGYNSMWPVYLRLARDLQDISHQPAVAVPLLPWHWWAATRARDATRILHRVGETVAWARRRLHADSFVLVGHSAGGLVARLYLCEEPIWGQAYAGVEHVTSIVTLGSPHCCNRLPAPENEPTSNWFLVDEANRRMPGATYGDRVQYLTVAGRYVQGREDGTYGERRAHRYYSNMRNQSAADWGDGLVPVRCAQLDGAPALVLDGVAHSARFGRPWYGGSEHVVQRWWRQEATGVR